MRPIDADALKDELCAYCEAVEPRMRDCLRIRIIDEMSTLNAVPVVRFKDCKHRNESKGCSLHSDDYFCAFGEIKDGEQDATD